MANRRKLYFYYNKYEIDPEKVRPLYQLAQQNNFTIVDQANKANIITSIGRDGAFLQAVRQTGFRNDCLYAGISISKQLSMYCDFHLKDYNKMVAAISEEQIKVRRYPTIEVTVDNQTSFHCLNEFVVRSGIIKTFKIDVFIDDLHFETFRGDGMVISTPTGSTAYNKSVKGAVVDPQLPCFQVSELSSLNNNRYRTLDSSFILSGNRKLTLKITQKTNSYPIMGMDNEALSIQHVDKIVVKLSNKTIKTVKLKDNSFWEKVKRRFL